MQMKQQYKEELEHKRQLVRENELANLEVDKEQQLGTSGKASLSKAERKKLKHERKNKQLKYVLGAKRQKQEEGQDEDHVPDAAKASKKQKRLAVYGVKE